MTDAQQVPNNDDFTLLDFYHSVRNHRERKEYDRGLNLLPEVYERCNPVDHALLYEGFKTEEMVLAWNYRQNDRAKEACNWILTHGKSSHYYNVAVQYKKICFSD